MHDCVTSKGHSSDSLLHLPVLWLHCIAVYALSFNILTSLPKLLGGKVRIRCLLGH